MNEWTAVKSVVVVALLACGVALAQSNNGIQYLYDDLGHLTKVIDPLGNTATYTYDALGNILKITRSIVPANGGIAIFTFAPQRGFVGQTITIQGQGFSPASGGNTVRFNGAPAVINSATANSLTVLVPAGAASGPISVTVAGSTANSDVNFTLQSPPLVSINVTPSNSSSLRLVQQFTAMGMFSDGSTRDLTSAVTWVSSNTGVATISNAQGNAGFAIAITGGLTTITAQSGGVVGSSQVNVTAVSAIEVFPAIPSIAAGATQQFAASGQLTDGSRQNLNSLVSWSSSNLSVSTISTAGLATGRGTGTAAITATFASASGSTGLIVNSSATPVFSRFAFVANTDGTISLDAFDPKTAGQLRTNGYMFDGTKGFGASIVVDPSNRFVYAANGAGTNSVSAFSITANGTLAPVAGSPFASGTKPVALVVEPSGRFLYVVNQDSNTVAAFRIDAGTGGLTPTPHSPFEGGTGGNRAEAPDAIAIDPSGKFVLVAEGGITSVAVYTIDQQTGDLVEIAASPFRTGNGPSSIATDRNGDFVYIVNQGDNNVSAFTIDQITGILTEVAGAPFAAGSTPVSIAIDPAGRFAYVANTNSNDISAFAIDFATGRLTPLFGSPVATGNLPRSVSIDPSGNFLYVVSSGNKTISVYGIDPTNGGLTSLANVPHRAPSSIAMTSGATAVTYTPQFAYVANAGPPSGSNDISGFAINPSTGGLTPMSGSSFAEGFSPKSVIAEILSPFLYVTNSCSDVSCLATNGSISAYRVDPSAGGLTALQGPPFLAGHDPRGVTVDPSGRFAYVVNNSDNTITAYTIDPASGSLSSIAGSPFPTNAGPKSVAIDVTGLFLYAVNSCSGSPCNPGSISAYTVSSVTGALTAAGTFAVGNDPQLISIDPTARFVYVANKGDSTVSAFAIDRTTGALNAVTGSPFATGQNPTSVAVDSSGKFVYTADAGDNSVSAYTINSFSGTLGAISGSPFPVGVNPISVTVDISGSFLYVVNGNDNTVSAFTIDPGTGALTPVPGSPFGTGIDPISVTTTGKIQ